MLTLLIFLGVLSVLVLIHELGHFGAAKLFGIKVEEFALGLPFTPPIFKWRRGETQYSLYPLLFGGFVRLHGEETEVDTDRTRSFWDRGRKQRMIVVAAGVVMNILLAIVAFVMLYMVVGVPQRVADKVTVVKTNEGGPAAQAGLQVKDRIVAVEGKPVVDAREFGNLMRSWAGLPVNLTVHRGETLQLFEGIAERQLTEFQLTIVPRANPPAGEGPAGVAIVDYPYITSIRCSVFSIQCMGDITEASINSVGKWVGQVIEGLRSVGKSLLAARAPEGVAGPIGIYKLTGLVAAEGLLPILELTAILSVNLAVFNVLPIPALDGGRMLFIWLEWVRRKRLTPTMEQKINNWGMTGLLALILLITLQDVLNLEFVKKIFSK